LKKQTNKSIDQAVQKDRKQSRKGKIFYAHGCDIYVNRTSVHMQILMFII